MIHNFSTNLLILIERHFNSCFRKKLIRNVISNIGERFIVLKDFKENLTITIAEATVKV